MTAASKIRTAAWYLKRPTHWRHAGAVVLRKALPDRDGAAARTAASEWAAARAVSSAEALAAVGLAPPPGTAIPSLPADLVAEATERASQSPVRMGGAGHVDLLHAATLLSGASRIVETGVAYGWSSLAILAALADRPGARLASVDMPYPKRGNDAFVGLAVPERLRAKWEIVREPDRPGLKKALAHHGGMIDLCHYDSDKSWYGRRYGYPLMWDALVPGGIFISDDIQDNLAFAEFVEARKPAFAVTEFAGKFVGIARKNQTRG